MRRGCAIGPAAALEICTATERARTAGNASRMQRARSIHAPCGISAARCTRHKLEAERQLSERRGGLARHARTTATGSDTPMRKRRNVPSHGLAVCSLTASDHVTRILHPVNEPQCHFPIISWPGYRQSTGGGSRFIAGLVIGSCTASEGRELNKLTIDTS